MNYIKMEKDEKVVYQIFVKNGDGKSAKVMRNENEIYILIPVSAEKEKSSSNNKLSHEEIDEIYKQLREGKGAHAIAKAMGISKKTVYNYKSGMIDL